MTKHVFLELPTRARYVLSFWLAGSSGWGEEREGITPIEVLRAIQAERDKFGPKWDILMRLPNSGKKTAADIRDWLARHGCPDVFNGAAGQRLRNEAALYELKASVVAP